MNYAGSSSHEGVFLLLYRIPPSQLFSIPPLTFLHSLFHSFKLIFSFSNTSIFFTLNHVFEISVSLPACSCMMPPGLPTLLLFCSLLHPLSLFPSFYLCLDVTHTHSSSLHLSVFLSTYPCGWSAEQRKGREPVVLDSHKCVKEEKRKSYGLSSAPTAQVSLLKRPVTNVQNDPQSSNCEIFVCL